MERCYVSKTLHSFPQLRKTNCWGFSNNAADCYLNVICEPVHRTRYVSFTLMRRFSICMCFLFFSQLTKFSFWLLCRHHMSEVYLINYLCCLSFYFKCCFKLCSIVKVQKYAHHCTQVARSRKVRFAQERKIVELIAIHHVLCTMVNRLALTMDVDTLCFSRSGISCVRRWFLLFDILLGEKIV